MNSFQSDVLNEDALRLLLHSAPIAIAAVDASGTILFVNDKLCDLFQYNKEELFGKPVELLLPQTLRQWHIAHRQKYATDPHVRSMGSGMDLSGRRKDGSIFPLEAGLSPIQLNGEQIVLSTIIDITQRKQAKEILERRVIERTRELERRRHIADSMRDILSKLNENRSLDETLQYIVERTESLLNSDGSAIFLLDSTSNTYKIRVGYGLTQIDMQQMTIPYTGQSLLKKTLTLQQTVAIRNLQEDNLGQDTTAQQRRQILLSHGYRALIVVPLMVNDEAYGALTVYYKGEREFVDEELELATVFGAQISLAIQNEHLRLRSEATAIAEERNRIARDLHDSVTQTLFSANMIAGVLPQIWAMQPEEGMKRLHELQELTHGALAEMRTLLVELRPAMLEDMVLPELLQQLIDGIAARGKFAISFQVDGDCALPLPVRVAFFRTAQEAMNNIAKHSQATKAELQLVCGAELVRLTVIDNGCGFRLGKITSNHLGLTIMRERAAEISGDLSIRSTPSKGTTIELTWKRREV